MPFETGAELQNYYQTKFEKIRRRAIGAIYKQLKTLAPLSPEYQEKMVELNALELRPDLGFYYQT